jgi:DNA-binding SARP family transcriptional activator/tetratricopeptide (TPR) repeat protein
MRIRLVGDVAVVCEDGTELPLHGVQPRVCLAFLVRERSRLVGRDEIAHLLWGDELPRHWEGAVRGVVAKVRAFLVTAGLSGELLGDRGRWRLLLPAGVTVDLEEAAAAVPAEAIALLNGEFVPGASGPWVDHQRAAVEGIVRRSLHALADAGDVDAARRLVELDPFDEAGHRVLMRAAADRGDRHAAVAAYDELRRKLAEDLGIRPDPATEALAAAIREEDVDVDVAPSPEPIRVPLPATPGGPLLGRISELSTLHAEWMRVVSSRRLAVAVLEGDAGAGKTRLALELIRSAGGSVLWGRCGPDRSVAYEPVLEALGRAVAGAPEVLRAVGPLAADLAPVLPELAGGATALAGSPEDAAARTRLFRAVAAAASALVQTPTVWVVDDLHWAGEDTLAMLRHLVDTLAGVPVLLVVTTRQPPGPVAGLLAHLTRAVPMTTIRLDGLGAREVAELLHLHGVVGSDELVAAVRDRTGGNPFFVEQLAALADERGQLDPLAIPEALRTWIERRVAALPPPAAAVLALAAVLGDDLDAALLAACSALDEEALLDACDELVAQRFLTDAGDGHVCFTHTLVRDAVYDGVRPSRRAWLHRRVASALASTSDRPCSRALHLSLAGAASATAAHAAFLVAGHQALGQAAWEAAADSFRRALDLPGARGPALVGLGRALRGGGQRGAARRAFEAAIALARSDGDARRLADAVLGLVGGGARGVADDLPDDERARLLREALDGLGPDDDDLVFPLHGELALALLLTDRVAEREGLARAGLERARQRGDPALLAQALLWGRLAHPGPEHAETRLDEVAELLALPAGARPPELTMAALLQRHEDHLLQGDFDAARRALADANEVLERYDHPYWRWAIGTWEALGLIIDGRLDDAEARALAALSSQAEHPEALACLGVNLVDIRLFQGRSGEMLDLLAGAADANPHIPTYRAVHALCLSEDGRRDEAERVFRTFADERFETIPDDTNRLLALAVLADVAVMLGDRDACGQLLALLRPHVSRQVVLNCFGGGGAWWGAVADHVAKLEKAITGAS